MPKRSVEGSQARAAIARRATIADAEALARRAREAIVQPGDMIVCLGAGDITKWAAGLADGDRRRWRKAPARLDPPPRSTCSARS